MHWLVALLILPTGETMLGTKLELYNSMTECEQHISKESAEGYTFVKGCMSLEGERFEI